MAVKDALSDEVLKRYMETEEMCWHEIAASLLQFEAALRDFDKECHLNDLSTALHTCAQSMVCHQFQLIRPWESDVSVLAS